MDAVAPCVQIAVHKAAVSAPQTVARGVGGGWGLKLTLVP